MRAEVTALSSASFDGVELLSGQSARAVHFVHVESTAQVGVRDGSNLRGGELDAGCVGRNLTQAMRCALAIKLDRRLAHEPHRFTRVRRVETEFNFALRGVVLEEVYRHLRAEVVLGSTPPQSSMSSHFLHAPSVSPGCITSLRGRS